MKKIQLKNVVPMDGCTSESPNMVSQYFDDSGFWGSGFWLDSGFWDESGNVFDIEQGFAYTYFTVEQNPPMYHDESGNYNPDLNTAISIRYIIMWSDGNIVEGYPIRVHVCFDNGMILDDESGNLGEAIKVDEYKYTLNRHQVLTYTLTGYDRSLRISGSYSIEYTFYPKGKDHTDDEGGAPVDKNKIGLFYFMIPQEYFTLHEE